MSRAKRLIFRRRSFKLASSSEGGTSVCSLGQGEGGRQLDQIPGWMDLVEQTRLCAAASALLADPARARALGAAGQRAAEATGRGAGG